MNAGGRTREGAASGPDTATRTETRTSTDPETILAEAVLETFRSSGPGGQNVNKVETAVRLRFDAAASPSLAPEVKARLLALAGRRATAAGEILLVARKHRTQERNRQEALAQLAALLERARHVPRKRRPTRPTRAAKARRLQEKARRSEKKSGRRAPPFSRD